MFIWPTVANCVTGALGALGRRFESCRPDSLNPSHTSELPRLAFLLKTLTAEKAVKMPSKQFFIKTIFKKGGNHVTIKLLFINDVFFNAF